MVSGVMNEMFEDWQWLVGRWATRGATWPPDLAVIYRRIT